MQFAVLIFNFCRGYQTTQEQREISSQLRRSAASVGANYRAAKRARSGKDFASKLGIAIEEAGEVEFWLEFLTRVTLADRERVNPLQKEANELVAIFTASQRTKRRNLVRKRKADERE